MIASVSRKFGGIDRLIFNRMTTRKFEKALIIVVLQVYEFCFFFVFKVFLEVEN